MRKKQLAIRTTFEEEVTLSKRSASLDGAIAESSMTTKDDAAGAPSVSGGVDPVYQFDSSGTATLQDGTVVVQPVSADTVSVPDGGKGFFPTSTVANIPAVKCTVCGMEMDPATSLFSIHPILQVIRCLPCAKFYRKQEFLRDSDGKDENCRWCADGGDLICCDHCPNAFCKRCIKRNLGRCALSNIESLDESAVWTCYVCDPSPIQSLRALCSEVLIKVDELKALRRRRSERAHASWKTRCVSAPKVSFPISPNTVSGCTSTSTPTAGSNETLKALTSIFSQLSQSVPKPGSQTDTSGLPDMNNLLQIMGQTLNTNNVNSNVSGPTAPTVINPSLPVTPPGWVLRNATTSHPTALSRCLVVNNQPNASVLPNTSVNVSVPSVSANSEISAILNQITSVNESNVRIALKAARRCIETFSADIRRLEQMSAKASSVNDLGRVVRSFHSIYRFHLFARLSNLSARMREEMPKAPEKFRALTTLQPATKSTSLFVPVGSTNLATVLSVPATLPSGLTIDLTDEFDRNRESNNPNSNQSVPEDMKSVVEEFKTTESGTRLSSSAMSPIISGAAVPVHNPVECDRKASSMSPAPKSPIAESVTVPTTSLTVSPKTNPVPSSVTVPPESTPSSSLPEKPCKLEPSADANEGPSEVSEPDDAHPEPNNRGETDDLGPVDDEDDDDDIDWKLDMLANLSQSETPKLIFTPNNQVENNNAQCAAGTVDSHSPRQSDIDPPDVSSVSPNGKPRCSAVSGPSVYLEDIRDQLGDNSFVRVNDEPRSKSPEAGTAKKSDTDSNSTGADNACVDDKPPDLDSDAELTSLEATVSSLERRCNQSSKTSAKSRSQTRGEIKSDSVIYSDKDQDSDNDGGFDENDDIVDVDSNANPGHEKGTKEQKSGAELSADDSLTQHPSSPPPKKSKAKITKKPATRFTARANSSDEGEELEEVVSAVSESDIVVGDAVPAFLRDDDLREDLLTEADAQYEADLAYRDRLLQDSSDEETTVANDNEDSTKDSTAARSARPEVSMVKSVSSNVSSSDHENNEEADTPFSRGLNKPKVKYHGVDEKLMQSVWSSSEDEDKVPKLKSNLKKKKRLDGKNEVRKEKSSGSDSEVVSKSDKRTRLLEDSDSGSATFTDESDEEVKPPKRRRQLVSEKNHRSKKAKSCLKSEKSDSKPRNYETDEDEDDNDVDENSERSKSQSEQKRPQKRRRRRVRTGASPNEDGTAEDQDSASDSCQDPDKMIKASADSGSDDGAGESSKGRKRIRKIYAKTKLSETTKSAEAEERERRKRLSERQKMYNHCLVQEGAGTHVVTKKLVLEKSSDGSEDLIEVHQHILKHLKPHQVEAVRFLWDCVIESVENQDVKNEQARGAILAHCMGLGKTLSVIAFLHTILSHPALLSLRTCLVICPVNTLLNWKNECEIWLPPDDPLDVFELSNRPDNRQRVDVLRHWQKDGGILLLGYDMFRNFVMRVVKKARSKVVKEAVYKALLDPGPDIVICDEGHVLKNCKSALAKSMSQLRTSKRVILTGTPLQNNLTEYHAMVSFVKPNLLGSAKEFSNRFANPIKNGQHSNSTQMDVQVMKKRAHVLYKTLDGCVQRKDYAALTKYLPPRYEYVVMCRLSTLQQEFYRLFLKYRSGSGVTETEEETAGQVRRRTLFMDQQTLYRIWTHPYLLRSHADRGARKMLLEDDDDDFIDDDPTSNSSSESTCVVESSSSSKEDADEVIPAGSSRNARARRRSRRGPQTRSCGTDDAICLDSDSGPEGTGQDNSASENSESRGPESWWSAQYREDYDWDPSVGVKLDVLLRILKKTCDIGDKLIVFTQSLLSLDLLERFLSELHRQCLASQGLAPEKSAKMANDRDQEERPDLSEYFSDMGLNTWVRGEDYERMDGSTNAVTRKELQRRFNRTANTRLRLFLISTRAGGLGINLIAANRIILFDACWNPSHDIQSIFRCYRFGQTKPVYIYRLIAQGTMEEKIYDRQVTKQSLSLRVLDEQQIDRHFTNADLHALYTFEPDVWDPATADERPTPKLPKDRLLADMLSEYPILIVNYHEHDSLLEHREDEGLTEEQRQEAWREYEEEKLYGMSLAQHQRMVQQQELHARWMRMQQQQQQQQLLQQQLLRFPSNSAAFRPPNPVFGWAHLNARSVGPPLVNQANGMTPISGDGTGQRPSNPQTNGNLYADLFEYYRMQLLSARPSLSGDPEQLKSLIMGNLMDHLIRTKALDPTQLQSSSTSNQTATNEALTQPGPSD